MEEYITSIKLKLYKPSKRKRDIIDEAMIRYTKTFQFLLDEIKYRQNELKQFDGKFKATSISKWIIKNYSDKIKMFNMEPFADSLALDVGALLSGYVNLKKKNIKTKFPKVYENENDMDRKYHKLLSSLVENKSNSYIEEKIMSIINKNGKLRPLFFCRYSEKRSYSLLYNPENNRYYVKLYLMNVKNENRKVISPPDGKKFYYLNKSKELFLDGKSKKCYIIMPICFGDFQQNELKLAHENPGIIKTARLIKEGKNYYIIINLKKECGKIIKTDNYLGITRGMDNLFNYAIVDKQANEILIDSIKTKNKKVQTNDLHNAANVLIKTAIESKSQILLEKLNYGDRLTLIDKNGVVYNPSLSISQYNEFSEIISYKSIRYGLPKPIFVSAIDIFSTCPICSNNSKENRFSDKLSICTSCGMVIDIESIGCKNIAKKLIKYSREKIIFKAVNVDNSVEFINEALGFNLRPENPFDCIDEFKAAVNELISDFNNNILLEKKKVYFKKRSSMIKKLEGQKNIFDIIEIE